MPGVWLAINAPVRYDKIDRVIRSQTNEECNLYPYKNRILFSSQNLVIGSSTPNGYPVSIYKNSECVVVVDGAIYGMSEGQLRDNLLHMCGLLRTTVWKTQCSEFIRKTDGEFIVIMVDTVSSRVCVFNDLLGRLPFYFSRKDNCLIAARSIKNIAPFLRRATLNNAVVACQILFEYPMDNGTLVREIDSWPPGHCKMYDGDKLHEMSSPVDLNFDKFEYHGSFDTMVEKLTSSLVQACERRVSKTNEKKAVLLLSGGYDSRIVAAALHRGEQEHSAVTRTTQLSAKNELTIAKKVCEILGTKHYLISASDISTELMIKVALARDGVLSVDLAYMFSFLIKVRQKFGPNVCLMTGDGGRCARGEFSHFRARSSEDLADYKLGSFSQEELSLIQEITTVKLHEIKQVLVNTFESYPETTIQGKYSGMMFRQKTRRLVMDGEDRNREVFWSTSPFYSPDVYMTGWTCPEKWKKNYKLILAILNRLYPKCSRLPRAGYLGGSFKQRPLINAYNVVASNKWLLKGYRYAKESRNRGNSYPLPSEFENFLTDLISSGHPLCDGAAKRSIYNVLSAPPTPHFRSRLISMIIALPRIWESIGTCAR